MKKTTTIQQVAGLLIFCFSIFTSSVFSQTADISAGNAGSHSIFLNQGKPMDCGNNQYGALGDGSTIQKNTPVFATGPLGGTTAIAAGDKYSLFLKGDGTVWATGWNNYGQLGDGSTLDKNSPVQVTSLSGIIAIAVGGVSGYNHSLFLKSDGTVWACGFNGSGQLGDNTIINKNTPIQVHGVGNIGYLTGIIAIKAGGNYSLFLRNDNTVFACGSNTYGQFGDGTTTDRLFPVQANSLTGVTAIAAGANHSLFLKSDGTVWSTGQNTYGQLGDGTTSSATSPVQIASLSSITAISTSYHSLFLKSDGSVWSCGWNAAGELGNGSSNGGTPNPNPSQIGGLTGILKISAGYEHSLFLKNDSTVWACGQNTSGELGDGTSSQRNSPVPVSFLKISTSFGNVTCNGGSDGSASVTAIGGTAPYSYSWSPIGANSVSVSGLTVGNYTITVNDANGVGLSKPITISEPPALVVNSGGNKIICMGSNVMIGGSPTASGGTPGYSYTWNPGSMTVANPSVNPASTTTYTVTVNDMNGCSKSASLMVTVNPTPTISASNVSICVGSSAPITASGTSSTYSWSPGTGLSGTIGATVTANPTTTTNYTVTGTSAAGCTVTKSVVVTVNPNPSPGITGTFTICNGASTTLTGTGGGTYNWSTSATTTAITVSPTSNTTYTVTVTNGFGCTAKATQAITVNPNPTPSITGTTTICNGSGTTLTASGGATYTWNTAATTASITVSPSSNTTYTVTANLAGCTGIATQTVTVNALPTPSTSGAGIICNGASTSLTAFGGVTYVWSNGASTTTISVTPSSNTTYTVTATNGAGCSANATKDVTVNPNPTATISGAGAICFSSSTTLTASGGGTYSWSNGGASTAAITVSPSTNTTYTVTVTNGSGCTAVATHEIFVNSVPSGSISGTTTICNGDSTMLTASGGSTYSWSNGKTTTSITVSPSNNTTYTVTVNPAGCSANVTAMVTVNPLPSASISGAPSLCMGSNTTLTASGGVTYAWNTGSSATTISVTPSSTTTYSVTVTDGLGCSAKATQLITVNPLPSAAITGVSTICDGENATLTASGGGTYSWSTAEVTASISVTPTVTTTYVVTVDLSGCTAMATHSLTVNPVPTANISAPAGNGIICDGQTSTITASGGGTYSWDNGETNAALTITPSSTTTYTVTVDVSGCTATAAQEVIVNPLPVASITGAGAVCFGDGIILTASGGDTYSWDMGETTSAITVSPSTNRTYTVTVTDAISGCMANTTHEVIINSVPIASITGASSVCNGESAVLTASGGTTYSWSTAEVTTSITVTPSVNATFTVTVTDAAGCTADATQDVSVIPAPNASIGGTTTICNGESTTLTAAGGETYLWSTGATGISITVTPSSTATYTVTVTGGGCTANATQVVTVNPLPAASISGTAGICNGASTTLTASGGTTYSWNTSAITAAITVSPSSTTTYTVTVTDATGCSADATQEVIVSAPPSASISGASTICNGASTTLTASGGTTYAWSNGASTTAITVSPSSNATYTVTVNSGGCTANATQAVTVNAAPAASISGTASICNGASTTFTASGGGAYSWNTSEITAAITVTPSGNTTYTVTVTAAGCSASATQAVMVNAPPTPSISGTTAICNGASTTLTASGGTTYLWNTSAVTAAITVTPSSNTTYTVTVTDASGCTANAIQNVTVNAPPSASISGTSTICNGSGTTLTASGGTAYYWSNGASTTAITVSPSVTTTYTVTVNSGGCTANATQAVTVNAAPTASISGSTTICNGTSTTLTAAGGTTYSWSNGASTTAITVTPSSNTSYSVTATTAGCNDTATTQVTVNAAPTPGISGTTTICNGSSTMLTASGGGTYLWNTGGTTAAITVSPSGNTTYTVTVTTSGCTGATSVMVSVGPSTNIYGHVNYSGGNLANGNVVLYTHMTSPTSYDSAQTFPLTASGDYLFSGLTNGNYLLEVFANTVSVPNGVPTYYGNKFLWDSSTVIIHGCNKHDTANILLIEIPTLPAGPGKISGNITKGPGFKQRPTFERTDPIPGVDVKLGKNPGGSANIVGQTRTDGSGGYTFDNLPLNAAGESYVVLVDIPGLGRDSSYVVVLSPAVPVVPNLDYIADSVLIYIPQLSVGIKNLNNTTVNDFNIYPNPSNGNATIEYSINADAKVSLDIYNVLGVKVYEAINTSQRAGTYKYTLNAMKNNMGSGIYLVTLIIDGKTSINRLVIAE